MAQLLKGAPAAAALSAELASRSDALKARGIAPTLAILRAGERPDDISYETGAVKRCEKTGIAVEKFVLPGDISKENLLKTVRQINSDSKIHGCLMLRPLPDAEAEWAACCALSPEKDVDGVTPGALGAVFIGRGAGYPPCTAQACVEILRHYGIPLEGKRVVVIGRSLVVGRPAAMLLQRQNATVTMCHSRTADLPAVCREADILIAAAGQMGMVDASYVRPGQVVIDVGIHVNEAGKLCGDVAFDAAEPVVSAITPVPGGVGAVTTAVLAKHVVEAAEQCL